MLFLVRHAETEWNRAGRYQGRSDPPLSAKGETEARLLAASFPRAGIAALLTSPLLRARGTARYLAESLGLPALCDQRLVELAYGGWEGLTQAEVKRRWPEMLGLWKKSPEQVRFPMGETLADLQNRVRSFLEDVARVGGSLVAVTHDAVIRIAILEVRKMPLSAFRLVRVRNGSITVIERGAQTTTETQGRS